MNSRGEVYVADYQGLALKKFAADGTFLRQWILPGCDYLAIDHDDNVYVTAYWNVVKYDGNGNLVREWGGYGSGDGQFGSGFAYGIGIGPSGRIYVADHGNQRIEVFAPDGTFSQSWSTAGPGIVPGYPRGVAVDALEGVYVATDFGVYRFTAGGELVCKWELRGDGDGAFLDPWDVTVAGDGSLYVTDVTRRDVQKFGALNVPVRATTWGLMKVRYR